MKTTKSKANVFYFFVSDEKVLFLQFQIANDFWSDVIWKDILG